MRENIDWNKEVEEDYRQRIIVDSDNPILAFKANRDRYTNLPSQREYAGFPYLGSRHSEDALTWNVFRSLQKEGYLNVITDFLGIGKPQGMLLWTLAPETIDLNSNLQYVTGSIIRKFDGKLPGQISEPDVIILGTSGVSVIECKLSKPGEAPSHLWEGNFESVKKRLNIYLKQNPELLKDGTSESEVAQVYQLVRMAFYAVELGNEYGRQPVLVSLANRSNWSRLVRKTGKSASDLWDIFRGMLGKSSPICRAVFWQELPEITKGRMPEPLSLYLQTHPCLGAG